MTNLRSRCSLWRSSILLAACSMTALSASAQNYSLTNPGYTAQRKPRVAVMEFEDTNTWATKARYGPSVSAMLVTFLKTKSQFVVVERQNISLVLDEWKNNQNGLTNLVLDATQSEILEKIDVILMGSVTLVQGGIEVDAKLLSRTDGRIITAAERSGPVPCLRQVADRVGVAIEQVFLKPYYGSLRLSLESPENTRVYLTPILSEDALDEEKPPVELDFTIHPGEEQDKIHHWITHPTSYTIKNILSGWYSLRLERPGYEGQGTTNALFEARRSRGKTTVRNLLENRTVDAAEVMGLWRPGRAAWEKYLVHVAPLRPNEVDATDRILNLRKRHGRVRFTVLDENARPITSVRVSLVSRDLELNPESPDPTTEPAGSKPGLEELPPARVAALRAELSRQIYQDAPVLESRLQPLRLRARPTAGRSLSGAGVDDEVIAAGDGRGVSNDRVASPRDWTDDGSAEAWTVPPGVDSTNACEFLVDEEIPRIDHGLRLVKANDEFELMNFEGGLLAIEDYRGGSVPEGLYEAFIWAPYYQLRSIILHVDDGVEPQSVSVRLARKQQPLLLRGRSENMISFIGKTMGHERRVPLDEDDGEKLVNLPVDNYRVDTDVIGFQSWLQGLDLLPPTEIPPPLEDLLPLDAAERLAIQEAPKPRELRIKNRVWVAGRFEDFRRHPGVFYDRRTSEVLDYLLGDPTQYRWDFELEEQEDDHLRDFEERLQDIDLLILNELDMSFLQVLPEVEEIVRRFVSGGGALMAFVTWDGDYGSTLGAPLEVKRRTSSSSKLKLNPGEVGRFETQFEIGLGSSRELPKPRHRQHRMSGWRILSYTKKGKKPRVIERGSIEQGGYVMVWFESTGLKTEPSDFASREARAALDNFEGLLAEQGPQPENAAAVPRVPWNQENGKRASKQYSRALRAGFEALLEARKANQKILMAKSMFKNRALLWAEYLMYRKFDTEEEHLLAARQRLISAGLR